MGLLEYKTRSKWEGKCDVCIYDSGFESMLSRIRDSIDLNSNSSSPESSIEHRSSYKR